MEELADWLEAAFERHFQRTPTEPSGYEYALIKEGDLDWERRGDPTAFVIAGTARVDEAIAEDIQSVLEDRHYDFDEAAMGEESEYAADAYYAEAPSNDVEFQASWREFEKGLKARARYFSHQADATLGMIFDGLSSLKTWQSEAAIRTIGPGTDVVKLHRARVFQSDEKLRQALSDPERWIGSPATEFAVAGRMNARGISTFYGASDKQTAVNEVRPPVGSRAVTAEFEILRPLKILDVDILRSIYVEGSLFDPAHAGRLEKAKFLASLASRITKSIMPDDEPVDYLVTQVMAEYLAERADPPLDGIRYASAQGGSSSFNVALFNKAARVEPHRAPAGTKTEVNIYEQDEDGWHESYSIWERVPKVEEVATPIKSGIPDFAAILSSSSRLDEDERDMTLRLDRPSLRVQHIETVTIVGHERHVLQHQSELSANTSSSDDPF
ncbi:MAG: RES family NAD+ phosphorylase [Sphingomonas sp.]|nr:RES family NAD+ phosphorylase [Sphingomonas sp.]